MVPDRIVLGRELRNENTFAFELGHFLLAVDLLDDGFIAVICDWWVIFKVWLEPWIITIHYLEANNIPGLEPWLTPLWDPLLASDDFLCEASIIVEDSHLQIGWWATHKRYPPVEPVVFL